jgi:hypothetical protein
VFLSSSKLNGIPALYYSRVYVILFCNIAVNKQKQWQANRRRTMDKALLSWMYNNRKLLGLVAIAICIITWSLELSDLVYVCPYCRAQRTIIGILGLMLLVPNPRHWINLYFASLIAAFGFFVGAYQHFEGWKKIMFGKFVWGEHWYINSWLLSGCALLLITGLLLLIWTTPNKHAS